MVACGTNAAPELGSKITRLTELPTLPIMFNRVIEITEDPASSADDLIAVISADQSLTSKILRLANSAYYGHLREIGTIKQAVVLLGFETVRSVSLSIAVLDSFFKDLPREVWEKLWVHCLGCAAAVRVIGGRSQELRIEEIYFSGLLHDIGKTVMMLLLGDGYNAARNMAEEGLALHHAEERLFGMDHCRAGALLADRWHFPEGMVESIGFHHYPFENGVERPRATATVYLADYMSKKLGMSGEPFMGDGEYVEGAMEALGIEEDELRGLLEELDEQRPAIYEMFAVFS